MLIGLVAVAAYAQPSSEPTPGLTDQQTAKLLHYRAVIENTAENDSTRQRQAEELLLTGWPTAADLLVELLETSTEASTRMVICRAVERTGATHPEFVDVRLAESLVRLLANGDRSVSTAASAALSTFREEYVVHRLGALARDPDRPVEQRLAIVDALAPNIDRRAVIAELIALIQVDEDAVLDRVLAALVPASRVNYGRRIEAWIAWWQEKSALDETAWLEDRVRLFVQRARELELRLEALRRESDNDYKTLAQRLGDALRLNYRLTAQEAQKDELLISWLRDPLMDFRRTAVDLVRERIYDQKLPSNEVRAALRERYADISPELRRDVFELVAALNDPADMEAIRARLTVETNVSVRETILGVLGKLRNPGAIEVLIGEIADASAPSPCVSKAAQSLATLARESIDPDQLEQAVKSVRARLASAKSDEFHLRGALLSAMASIGPTEFAAEFVAHLNETHPELLLPAIRGIVAVQDRSQVDHLRTLFLHTDPRVRLRAIEAVGVLGDGESPLEALANHMNVATEPNEAVRWVAWEAFCKILQRQPAETRLRWVDRLKDLPERKTDYLTALVQNFASANPVPAQLGEARERLALLLREQGRYAESVRYLQECYAAMSAESDPRAGEMGVLLLDSMLRNGQHAERIDQLLAELAKQKDDVKTHVTETIKTYVNGHAQGNADPELVTRVQRLQRACAGLYGQSLDDYLDDAVRRLVPPPTTAPANQS